MEKNKKYTCPVCGYLVFEETIGSDEICPICFWHDDAIDLQVMYEPMGPNHVSLEQAQKNYIEFGASENRLKEFVRKPTEQDGKDTEWRSLDRAVDTPRDIAPYCEERKEIYYWLWS